MRKKAGYALEKVDINRWDGTPERLLPHAYPVLRSYVQVVKTGDPSPCYFLETVSFVYKIMMDSECENQNKGA